MKPSNDIVFVLRVPWRLLYAVTCLGAGLVLGKPLLSHVVAGDEPVLNTTQMVIPYEGKLSANGVGLTGNRDVTFELYDVSDALVWSETQDVMFLEGKFSVNLGSITSLTDTILDAEKVWLKTTLHELDASGAEVAIPFGAKQEIKPAPTAAWSAYSADFMGSGKLNVTGTTSVSGNASLQNNVEITGAASDGSSAALMVSSTGSTSKLYVDGNGIDSDGWVNFQFNTGDPVVIHDDLRITDTARFGDGYVSDTTTIKGAAPASTSGDAALEVYSASNQGMMFSGTSIETLYNQPLYLNNNNATGGVVVGNDMRLGRFRPSYSSDTSTGDGGAYMRNTQLFGLTIQGNNLSGDYTIKLYDDLNVRDQLATSGTMTVGGASSVTGSVTLDGELSYTPQCPNSPKANIYQSTSRSRLCVYHHLDGSGSDWNEGSDDCWNNFGAEMCTYNQLRLAASKGNMGIVANYWLRDRTQNNVALRTNGTSATNFESASDYTTNLSGAYCCIVLSGR